MVVFLDCENGLQKKFELNLIDADPLNLDFNADMLPVRITAEANEMGRLLSSFNNTLDDVTVLASPEGGDAPAGAPHQPGGGGDATLGGKMCHITSFYDPAKVVPGDPVLHTAVHINVQQHFVHYENSCGAPVDVTFNLKDFRVILNFCAAVRSTIQMLFSGAGEPIAVVPALPGHDRRHTEFSAEFVLATHLTSAHYADAPHSHEGVAVNEARRALPVEGVAARAPAPAPHDAMQGRGGGSEMRMRRAAKHLLGMNGNPESYVVGSTATTTDVMGSEYDRGQHSKRTRMGPDPSATVSLPMRGQDLAHEYVSAMADEGDDEDDDEVPATPPHARASEALIENWV